MKSWGDIEIVIISLQASLRYFTGLKFIITIERPILLALNVRERRSIVFVPPLELVHVEQSLGKSLDKVLYYADHEDPYLRVNIFNQRAAHRSHRSWARYLLGFEPMKSLENTEVNL